MRIVKPLRVDFTKQFQKQLKKVSVEIKKAFKERLILFRLDRYNSFLNNHSLTGKLLGYKSINITGDWRALYTEYEDINDIKIVFESLGTHSQLYK